MTTVFYPVNNNNKLLHTIKNFADYVRNFYTIYDFYNHYLLIFLLYNGYYNQRWYYS